MLIVLLEQSLTEGDFMSEVLAAQQKCRQNNFTGKTVL